MKRLAHAPHRLYFFLGALAVSILFSWWWWQLQSPRPIEMPLHAVLMPLGVFPLFILGFTFTAGPKWLSLNEPPHNFLLHGGTYFSGLLLALFASTWGLNPLRMSGFALMLAAWCAVTFRWARLILLSPVKDKNHAQALLFAMTGGILSLACAFFWSAGVREAWVAARQMAFFAFLLPVFLTVCHRMLPFFSSNVIRSYTVWRPYWLLNLWIGSSWALAFTGILEWHVVEAVLASMLSLSFANTSWRWGLFRSLENRLLAMLHLSFAWLSVVFALQAVSAFGVPIGSAMIHALALGFMGTMLVGFVSRVSFGHSGRPLQASNALWCIYLALHIAALLRVVASVTATPQMLQWSASIWLLLILAWIGLMLPIYLTPRADGQAG
ncbi:NnrS family protein [Undibacterium fentianense]|uniref:NnrS family protein n=1 Tax=Undibacterium fentianense TaxID=2828728 RepID=A0A941IF87_9BURK|nr:NnrS family protein [Undibacterium fentianense]MBR7800132.1 NnrS family protein [Undibacterium fentianense]